MLEVKNLRAGVVNGDGEDILKGLDLNIGRGEIHAVMGPNGSGKSTLANVIAGRPDYEVTGGDVLFEGESLLGMPPDKRAQKGIFLAFQYPSEIPGVRPWQFLKTAHDSITAVNGGTKLTVRQFSNLFDETVVGLDFDLDLMKRSLNEGFSGGEKKRNEVLQMAILQPKFAIMDETDSGLDVDALRVVSRGVNALRSPDRSFVIVTHYNRILRHIEPDVVHVLANGRIIRTGGKELAMEIEENGYETMLV